MHGPKSELRYIVNRDLRTVAIKDLLRPCKLDTTTETSPGALPFGSETNDLLKDGFSFFIQSSRRFLLGQNRNRNFRKQQRTYLSSGS